MERIVLGLIAWVMVPITLMFLRMTWEMAWECRHERSPSMIAFTVWIAPLMIVGLLACMFMILAFGHAALTGSMLVPGTEINMGRR